MPDWISRLDRTKLTLLALRVALATQLLAASYEALFLHGLSAPTHHENALWMATGLPLPAGFALAVLVALLALSLLIGLQLRPVALTTALVLLLYCALHLLTDPLYNLTEALVQLLVLTVAIVLLQDRPTAANSRQPWAALIARLLVGSIFIAQGFKDCFLHGGVIPFAQRAYVIPFHALLPDWILWTAGITNPPWEL